MRIHSYLRATLIAVSVTSLAATASTAQTPSWKFTATPYAWLAGLGGQVGVRNVETHVDIGVGEVLDHLKFAAMAAGSARHGALVLGADVVYTSLGGSKAVAVRGASGDLTLDQRETIVHGVAGYTPLDTRSWTVDLLVGARYWNLSSDLGIDPANHDARSRSGTIDWIDATGGVRARYLALEDLNLVADVDGGAGGSRGSWRLAGTANYAFSPRYAVVAGYKYLSVDYRQTNFLFDTHTSGWLAGVTFSF